MSAQKVGTPGSPTPTSTPSVADTTKNDSVKKKDITPHTVILTPDNLVQGKEYRRLVSYDLVNLPYSDVTEKMNGFVQTLGQIGKPYLCFYDGAPSSFFRGEKYINPITGAEEAYLINPSQQILFFDSRTPYVNIDFAQGGKNYSVLQTTVSRNISPFINLAGVFKRKLANGTYNQFVTDHYNMYFSGRARSRDNKYQVYAAGLFDQMKDQMNGGVQQYVTFDSIPFLKAGDVVSLDESKLFKKHRSLFFNQSYQLVHDTLNNPNQFRIFNSVLSDEYRNSYWDVFETGGQEFYPVYPTLDTTVISELGKVKTFRYEEGLNYQLKTSWLQMSHKAFIANEIIRFFNQGNEFRQERFTTAWMGHAHFPMPIAAVHGEWNLSRTTSNFFEPENYKSALLEFSLFKARENYEYSHSLDDWHIEDTVSTMVTHRPLTLGISWLNSQRNPSLYNTFWTSYVGNHFTSERTLGNEGLNHLRAYVFLRGKEKSFNKRILAYSFNKIALFQSTMSGMIWYDQQMYVKQAWQSEYIRWEGIEESFRLRLRRYTFEGKAVAQRMVTNSISQLKEDHIDYLPKFYGKFGAYYERHGIAVAEAIRAGIEVYYQSAYKGKLFDPASQQFYSQTTFELPANFRFDFYASVQIKKAMIFVRLVNILEGVGKLGYFTTPYYPMLERTVQLGVNWTFFD